MEDGIRAEDLIGQLKRIRRSDVISAEQWDRILATLVELYESRAAFVLHCEGKLEESQQILRRANELRQIQEGGPESVGNRRAGAIHG